MVSRSTARERRLRRVFGPPGGRQVPPAGRPARRSGLGWRWPAAGGLLLAAAAGLAFLALTPHVHVASGCRWWTATPLSRAVAGSRGCVRGWAQLGGWLGEGPEPGAYALPTAYGDPDRAARRTSCPYRPGDAVVIRYHAVFDDGQTILVIDGCR